MGSGHIYFALMDVNLKYLKSIIKPKSSSSALLAAQVLFSRASSSLSRTYTHTHTHKQKHTYTRAKIQASKNTKSRWIAAHNSFGK